ncbi:MAG: hypothetical protein LBQ40_02015, partial [Clostridiales bacterium]|nr:hypothetical protein [Clostridiales bacterium]
MAIPVPSYLEHIAKIEKSKKDYAEFSLACPCGSDGFIVYKNYFSAEDIARAKEWEKRYDDYWRRKFFCGKSYFYEKDKETGKLYERRMFLSIIN